MLTVMLLQDLETWAVANLSVYNNLVFVEVIAGWTLVACDRELVTFSREWVSGFSAAFALSAPRLFLAESAFFNKG